MVMIYPHTIRYGQSNQPGEYDVAHDPTYIYTHNMYIYIYMYAYVPVACWIGLIRVPLKV